MPVDLVASCCAPEGAWDDRHGGAGDGDADGDAGAGAGAHGGFLRGFDSDWPMVIRYFVV